MKTKNHTLFFNALIITFILLCSTVNVKAYQIGEQIDTTVYTDIIASINDHNIASFNINGYTVVVAEDLRNYGFDVIWNPNNRSLSISRAATNKIASLYVAPKVSKDLVGQPAFPVLYTDIKTYINGKEITSYNIDGKTIIYFNDLSVFGIVSYNDSTRRIDLYTNNNSEYKTEKNDIPAPNATSNTLRIDDTGFNLTDREMIEWINANTALTVDYTELGIFDGSNTAYYISYPDDIADGLISFAHHKSGKVCAMLIAFSNSKAADIAAIYIGDAMTQNFDTDAAIDKVAANLSYTSGGLTIKHTIASGKKLYYLVPTVISFKYD